MIFELKYEQSRACDQFKARLHKELSINNIYGNIIYWHEFFNRCDIYKLKWHFFYTMRIFLLLDIFFRNFLDTDEHSNETVRFIQQLAKTDGKLESPINLNISYMKVVKLNPVQWLNYNVMPKKMKLTNSGYTG